VIARFSDGQAAAPIHMGLPIVRDRHALDQLDESARQLEMRMAAVVQLRGRFR